MVGKYVSLSVVFLGLCTTDGRDGRLLIGRDGIGRIGLRGSESVEALLGPRGYREAKVWWMSNIREPSASRHAPNWRECRSRAGAMPMGASGREGWGQCSSPACSLGSIHSHLPRMRCEEMLDSHCLVLSLVDVRNGGGRIKDGSCRQGGSMAPGSISLALGLSEE